MAALPRVRREGGELHVSLAWPRIRKSRFLARDGGANRAFGPLASPLCPDSAVFGHKWWREVAESRLRGLGGYMISSLLEIMAVVGALELVVAVGEAILIVAILRWVRP